MPEISVANHLKCSGKIFMSLVLALLSLFNYSIIMQHIVTCNMKSNALI